MTMSAISYAGIAIFTKVHESVAKSFCDVAVTAKAFSNGPHEWGRRPNVTYGRHPLLLFLTFLSQCLHVAYFGSAILLSKWAQTGEMYLVALSGILRC